MKVRWRSSERALIIEQIKADRENPENLPKGVSMGLTDVYFDYVQEKLLPPERWIDWRNGQAVNPDITACFGKKNACKIRITQMGKPKIIENLEREIENGKQQANRDRAISTALESLYELAGKARSGDVVALRAFTLIGQASARSLKIEHDVSEVPDDDLAAIIFPLEPVDPNTAADLVLGLIKHDSPEPTISVPAPVIAPVVEVPVPAGPSPTTIALREISSKKTRFVVVGALAKHQNQVDQALRGNESRIEIVWQPRCRNWKESVKNADAVMMSNLCDAPSRDSCKQFCKANSIPFEPSGTGKTAIVAWVARYTASDIKVDGRWLKDKTAV